MTSTIGLYVLDFLGSYNVLFLVHFECMYQQMKLWVAFKYPIDVGLILASLNTPILNYEFSKCTGMVNRHTHTFLRAQTPPQMKLLEGIQLVIDVGSCYKLKQLDKVNASFVYNVDKILSQFNNFQHLSTFDA